MSIRMERRWQPKKRKNPAVVRKQKINKKRALNSYVQSFKFTHTVIYCTHCFENIITANRNT
ncbi:hypothetical protein E4N89_07275 [Treponema denticola]|uniref:hypothetical protein n=1 Tax=Treponema denticola TaxID=158 RepID=UPI003D8C74E3